MVFVTRSSTSDSSFARVKFDVEVFGPRRIRRDERQVDFGLHGLRQVRSLAFSAASFKRCRASLSLRKSMPCSFLNSSAKKVDDARIKIFTAEEGIAVGGFDFEHAIADFKDGYVERPAAKVIDRDRAGFFLSRP
jgi:hypothetical protein